MAENTEKYISFSVPIKKVHDNDKTTTCKIKFIDTCRLMQSKLSDLADNLCEINNKDCKSCIEIKKISNQNVNLLGSKIIDWSTDVKNARGHLPSQ